jgi:hypothetical protein
MPIGGQDRVDGAHGLVGQPLVRAAGERGTRGCLARSDRFIASWARTRVKEWLVHSGEHGALDVNINGALSYNGPRSALRRRPSRHAGGKDTGQL